MFQIVGEQSLSDKKGTIIISCCCTLIVREEVCECYTSWWDCLYVIIHTATRES